MSTHNPQIECTPEELKELEAVLGQCSCDPALDRDWPDPHCSFHEFAADVLLLIRQRDLLRARCEVLLENGAGLIEHCEGLRKERDHLRARMAKLFARSGLDIGNTETMLISGEALLEKNEELFKRCEELQKERDHLRKLVECTRYFQKHVPEEST